MIQLDGIWFYGEDNPDCASLFDVASQFADLLPSLPWGLITGMDGGRGEWVCDKFKSFLDSGAHSYPYEILGGNVLLSGSDLQEVILEDKFFGGFDDEVWLFDSAPQTVPPENLRLTSVASTDNRQSARYTEYQQISARWMKESQCILGLGDGHGLRFVTPQWELAHLLSRR